MSLRIGESRLLAARDRRWSHAYNPLDPMIQEIAKEESSTNRRAVRLGVLAAIVFHVLLFFIVFPSYLPEEIYKIGGAPRVYKLQQVRFSPPPKPRVQRQVVKPKARRVPVPDPTPDEPEPLEMDGSEVSDVEFPEAGLSVELPGGPPGPAVGPMQIAGDVQAPVRLYAPDPHYPEEARQARVQGVVILQTIIDVEGNVRNIKVLKGLPSGLTESAVEAVATWRFEPATLNGKPVAVYYLVTVSFSVQ